ncbi:phage tail fiber protein [Acinetobacter sp. ANC 4193]
MNNALRKELQRSLDREQYDITKDGLYFPRQGVIAKGKYYDRINDGEWSCTDNLVVTEGLTHMLNVALGSTAKPAGYYLALFSGTTAPAANWTAATFPSVAQEVISLTEGYADETRPVWTPGKAANGSISNSAAASLVITTATALNVTGLALLTNNTRGGTSGVLVSATKFASARSFQNGDVYQIGYELDLSA